MPISLKFSRIGFSRLMKRLAAREFFLGATLAGFPVATISAGHAAIVGFRAGPGLSVMLIAPVPRPVFRIAPPAPRIIVTPVPRAGWIWSPGYWRWTGATYVWIDGFWLPRRPGYGYVAAHWILSAAGWAFVPGAWVRRPL